MIIKFLLNNRPTEVDIPDGTTLLELLRDVLQVHSVKRGCENAECGSCTVLVNDTAVNSCIYLAARIHGQSVTTLEGLGSPDNMHLLQKSFVDNGALQCGFCGSGMILSALSLLHKNPNPSEEEIRQGLAGNLCRCTGYTKVIKAVQDAADRMNREDLS